MSAITLHRNKNGTAENRSLRSDDVPPLRNGDHLTVPEFERRYWAMPEVKNAELVEGIVIMPSPVSDFHSDGHAVLAELLRRYSWQTEGTKCHLNPSVRLDGKNEYQPDVLLRICSGPLAKSKVATDRFFEGAPELVAEISVSSIGYDLHEKKAVYQRNLIQEYLVWQVMDSRIQWFGLEQGEFAELKSRADGVVCSRVFPGLWLDIHAMLNDDPDKPSRVLDKGVKSAGHRAFVKRLSQKGKS